MPAPVLPVLGALACLPAFGNVAFDEVAVVQTEIGAGTATAGPRTERSTFAYAELRPSAVFVLRTTRTNVELTLGPRFYYRLPNEAGLDRPLVLAGAAARHEYAFSPRLFWTTTANAQYGEIEYSRAELVFDSPLVEPDTDPVVTAFDAHAQTGFRWIATERYTLSMAAVGGRTAATSPDESVTHPTTTTVGGDATQSYQLDTRTNLSFPATGRYYFVTTSPDWTAFSLSSVYRHSPGSRTTLEAAVGATAAWPTGGDVRVYPRALGAIERVVHETRAARFSNRLAVALDTTFDPLLGRIYPVVGLEASLFGTLGARWTMAFAMSAYTAATSESVTVENRDTTFNAIATFGYELTDAWSLGFGVRTGSRAPHVLEGPFALHGYELWTFARLTGSFGARPDMAR